MTKAASPFVILMLYLLLAGCGDSGTHHQQPSGKPGAVNDLSGLCASITGTGLAKQCAVNSRGTLVEVMIDSFDDEVAREACANIVNKTTQETARLSGQWELQIFSPYRSDKPIATCSLN